MWLLDTECIKLKFFSDPEKVPGGYAILSHVWDEAEQTFHGILDVHVQCSKTRENPLNVVSSKIKEACLLARRHQYAWIWIDTCCIDKTSSAELSEAINSMYAYYAHSEVCYAYLRDVPSHAEDRSFFRQSRWHTRGWTLQELLAPQVVIFVSQNWKVIGTKIELAELLSGITGIPASVLTFETEIADASVAQRMSWAARRTTTRIEDEVYSLLGIFGINMPTLYGEGRQAFYRLQEEIMRRTIDTSIFAWGANDEVVGLESPSSSRSPSPDVDVLDDHTLATLFLLAPSPAHFLNSSDITFVPRFLADNYNLARQHASLPLSRNFRVPKFELTSYGVRATIPVLSTPTGDRAVAVLSCSIRGEPLGLSLTQCPTAPDPTVDIYHCAPEDRLVSFRGLSHITVLESDRDLGVHWSTIYLAHRPPPTPPRGHPIAHLLRTMNGTLAAPFRFPAACARALEEAEELFLDVRYTRVPARWTESASGRMAFSIGRARGPRYAAVTMGRCAQSTAQLSSDGGDLGFHWARVRECLERDLYVEPSSEHVCAEDHVVSWKGQAKVLEMKAFPGQIRMWFTECPLSSSTLVLHLASEFTDTSVLRSKAIDLRER